MNEIRPTQKTVKEMEVQFRVWAYFLNNVIGLFAFTLGLGCLGTHSPSLNALFSFILLCAVYSLGWDKFSRIYKELRDKKEKTTLEKVFYAGATKHFLGFRAMLAHYIVFFMGISFLVFIMLSSTLAERFLGLKNYFYGA